MKVMIFAGYSKSILLFNRELVIQMKAAGHEVVCVGPENDDEAEFKKIGAKLIALPFNRHSTNPFSSITIVKHLCKIIKSEKIDLFYGFTAVPVAYGIIAAKLSKMQNIYAAITGAGKIVFPRNGLKNKLIRFVLTLLYKSSLRYCKKVFFLNDDNMNYFIKNKIVKSSQAVKVNGSGVNTEKFSPLPLPNENSFLYIGSLMRFKGIIEYMEAARTVRMKYPDAEFHIVGEIDGRLSSITQDELDEYTTDNSVIHHGYQKDVRPFLKECRYFVLPSYSEGIPTCVIEAMATRRPIITTLAPGCRETVIDGKNGFLVPVKNVDALAEKMIYMIEHPDEIEKMSEYSLELVKEKFDVNIVNDVMLKTMNLI